MVRRKGDRVACVGQDFTCQFTRKVLISGLPGPIKEEYFAYLKRAISGKLQIAPVPLELRRIRGAAMLEKGQGYQYREVSCPACGGTGESSSTIRCRLCLGFKLVPYPLSDWWINERDRLEELSQRVPRQPSPAPLLTSAVPATQS
jgi:hypothetical protein